MKHNFLMEKLLRRTFEKETSEKRSLKKASSPQEPLSIFSYDDKPLPQPNQDLCLHPPLGM